MPTEVGYELIRRVRALGPESGGTMPAVALTGYASEEDAARARVAGFELHLAKPVSAEESNRMATAFEHDEMVRAQRFCAV